MRVLVTGASGFVGRAVVNNLKDKYSIRVSVRDSNSPYFNGWDCVEGQLTPDWNWRESLYDISVVIHCAARVHIMNDVAENPLEQFRLFNRDATINLARQAASLGVRRFVFISSIKVNGEATVFGAPFSASDMPMPVDPYGISKFEAELALLELSKKTGMEVVIIRPPLVYGFGAKANFRAMIKCVTFNVPLPLASVSNKRSIVGIDNLVSLISTCLDHPAAAGEVFLVSDGEDVSTAELIQRTASALNKRSFIFHVPVKILRMLARFIGREDVAQRLIDSLQVDITKTCNVLSWRPPLSLDQGLIKAVRGSGR